MVVPLQSQFVYDIRQEFRQAFIRFDITDPAPPRTEPGSAVSEFLEEKTNEYFKSRKT